jgi:hypothetical protein
MSGRYGIEQFDRELIVARVEIHATTAATTTSYLPTSAVDRLSTESQTEEMEVISANKSHESGTTSNFALFVAIFAVACCLLLAVTVFIRRERPLVQP